VCLIKAEGENEVYINLFLSLVRDGSDWLYKDIGRLSTRTGIANIHHHYLLFLLQSALQPLVGFGLFANTHPV